MYFFINLLTGQRGLVAHFEKKRFLNDLKKKYSKQTKNLRRNNPFELIILENDKKYLNISKNRIVALSNAMSDFSKFH